MFNRLRIIFCVFVVFMISSFTYCNAKEINFSATIDSHKVSMGSSVQLNLAFEGTQNMPVPQLSDIDGFQARYLGPSSMMSVVNGKVSSSITHIYSLLALKTGVFKIGPFKFEHNGDTYVSNQLSIEVVQGQVPASSLDTQEGEVSQDVSDRIFLILNAEKKKVYLNEPTKVSIKLYVNKLGVRDIQLPEISHEGFSIGEFDKPQQYREVLGGVEYEVIEFTTVIFGIKPGEFRLGPASLKCNLMVRQRAQQHRAPAGFEDFFNSDIFEDFFGVYQTYPMTLKSADIPFTVLALPSENKPGDFSGALGDFSMNSSLAPSEVKAGDPVTLKVEIEGSGNFNTVNMPKINVSEKDFKVYEPQVKLEPNRKTFEQILIPLTPNVTAVPEINFSFFDTKSEKYNTVSQGPFPIRVLKPDKEEKASIVESSENKIAANKEEPLGRDIIYIKDALGSIHKKGQYLYKSKFFIGFQFLPLLALIIFIVFHSHHKRMTSDTRYARKFQAPRKAKIGINKAKEFLEKGSFKEFYDTVFNTLQEYLGDKFHLSSKSITISVIDDELRNKGVAEPVLAQLRDIFRSCDMARYAASSLTRQDQEVILSKLQEVIGILGSTKSRSEEPVKEA